MKDVMLSRLLWDERCDVGQVVVGCRVWWWVVQYSGTRAVLKGRD